MVTENNGKKDNGKGKKVKEWWQLNRIVLGFWVIIIVIAFGIAQPIIWYLWLKTSPPKGAMDIADLLLILITLLALGLTGFSVLIYEALRERLSARITQEIKQEVDDAHTRFKEDLNKIKNTEEEAHEHIDEHVEKAIKKHEEISKKAKKEAEIRQNLFRARMLRSMGYTFWQLFSVWEEVKVKDKRTEDIDNHTKKIYAELIKLAIERAKTSLDLSKELPEKYKEDIYKCRTNWMYFLAESVRVVGFERTELDVELALNFSNEILEDVCKEDYPNDYYHYKESCAWALQHLSEKEDKISKQKASNIIHELIEDDNIPPSWREDIRIKWEKIWEAIKKEV